MFKFQTPQVVNVENLLNSSRNTTQLSNGMYVEARPLSIESLKMRFLLAYKVFTGQADALVWVGDQGKQSKVS